ncbi:PREDICTED: thymopoietin isoform X2 [Thamnophis sirtalis]|uniref:Thymopoietin isoform X2 n=1 Tax=Thamnophis sirtalis TaxID=35019 RepID=A0A6I9XQM0_9SAUR|nr:PREDICTED: thymopoietin isoform X2 [Thamnophis sirtalis]
MPEFLADPSVLTKEKLKSELIANNVSLPGGEQRKDVYVQLYLQHLTARNVSGVPAQPDFSSDEERESTPVAVRNRGGSAAAVAVGRKATKKTDKSRLEQDDIDIAELSNEELKEQLLRYGVNPGPIVATTRKLYEKKLLKLKEPSQDLSPFIATPTFSSSAENNKQNGNDDSDQFSDNEEDPKTEFRLDQREPLKSKTKTLLSLKQRRIAENNQDGITETFWRSGSSKSGLLQAVSRESSRVSRRTPRKRVETTVPFPVHDPVISENTPIAVVASSNKTLVVNRVPGNTKHADPILSISDFSELPRRTPKKPLMSAEVMEKMSTEDTRLERDILKEMFPYEASTPTGISASCRRPIKGAAGRPIEFSDYRLEENYSSKYIPKYVASAEVQKEKTTIKKHSIPLWIKFLLFFVVAIFLVFVYQSMEINQGNPFSKFLTAENPQKTTN